MASFLPEIGVSFPDCSEQYCRLLAWNKIKLYFALCQYSRFCFKKSITFTFKLTHTGCPRATDTFWMWIVGQRDK